MKKRSKSNERHDRQKYMFAMVALTSDNNDETVEAVPLSWLTPEKSHCYLPPFTEPGKVQKAISGQLSPMADWLKYYARCLKKCQDFKTARQKSIEAQFTSDLNTDETYAERIKSRAQRHKSNHYQETGCLDSAAEPLALTSASLTSVPLTPPAPTTLSLWP